MTTCHFIPKDIEIKRDALAAWEPLPDNARVGMDALTNDFELVEQWGGAFPTVTSLYDVRDNLRSSWRAEREMKEAYTLTGIGKKGAFTDRILNDVLKQELAFLHRTIGSAPWLDCLDDEQWRVLSEEIMPVYHRAERRRAGISARDEMPMIAADDYAKALEAVGNWLRGEIEKSRQ